MTLALIHPLKTWNDAQAIDAKDAVLSLEDHPGLTAIYDAIEKRRIDLIDELTLTNPSDNAAEYADKIGMVKGLAEIPAIVDGIIENGRRAEQALRDRQLGE